MDMNQVLLLLKYKNYRKNYKKAFKLKENEFIIKEDKRKSFKFALFEYFLMITIFLIVTTLLFQISISNLNSESGDAFVFSVFYIMIYCFFIFYYITKKFEKKEFEKEKYSGCYPIYLQLEAFKLSFKMKKILKQDEKFKIYFSINEKNIRMELTIDEIIHKLENLIFNNEIIKEFSLSVLEALNNKLKKDEEEKQKFDKVNQEDKEKIYKIETNKYLDQLLEKNKLEKEGKNNV